MKKILIVLSVLLLMVIMMPSCYGAESGMWISLGTIDQEQSITIGRRINDFFGMELGYMRNTQAAPDLSDYPTSGSLSDPGEPYKIVDKLHDHNSLGIDLLWYIKKVYIGTGVYVTEKYIKVSPESKDTLYYKATEKEWKFPLSLGFQTTIKDKHLIGVGYHSVRGYFLQYGRSF